MIQIHIARWCLGGKILPVAHGSDGPVANALIEVEALEPESGRISAVRPVTDEWGRAAFDWRPNYVSAERKEIRVSTKDPRVVQICVV